MNLISREELKKKIDNNDEFKLVMTLGDFAFNAKHIPGSIQVDNEEKAKKLLSVEDEIVVYCSGPNCKASIYTYESVTNCNRWSSLSLFEGPHLIFNI